MKKNHINKNIKILMISLLFSLAITGVKTGATNLYDKKNNAYNINDYNDNENRADLENILIELQVKAIEITTACAQNKNKSKKIDEIIKELCPEFERYYEINRKNFSQEEQLEELDGNYEMLKRKITQALNEAREEEEYNKRMQETLKKISEIKKGIEEKKEEIVVEIQNYYDNQDNQANEKNKERIEKLKKELKKYYEENKKILIKNAEMEDIRNFEKSYNEIIQLIKNTIPEDEKENNEKKQEEIKQIKPQIFLNNAIDNDENQKDKTIYTKKFKKIIETLEDNAKNILDSYKMMLNTNIQNKKEKKKIENKIKSLYDEFTYCYDIHMDDLKSKNPTYKSSTQMKELERKYSMIKYKLPEEMKKMEVENYCPVIKYVRNLLEEATNKDLPLNKLKEIYEKVRKNENVKPEKEGFQAKKYKYTINNIKTELTNKTHELERKIFKKLTEEVESDANIKETKLKYYKKTEEFISKIKNPELKKEFEEKIKKIKKQLDNAPKNIKKQEDVEKNKIKEINEKIELAVSGKKNKW